MLQFVIKRTLFAIPTLLIISMILFAIIDLAPGDPTASLPLTIPAEQKAQIRETLGLNDSMPEKWLKWADAMIIKEPQFLFEKFSGVCIGECVQDSERIVSFTSRGPALDTVYQRLPQTLWVMGLSLIFGTLIAIPIGIISAYRQYSVFDNVGTFVTMVGFALPVYFTGLLAIYIFSVKLGWFPSLYDTTHDVQFTSWSSIWTQIKQLAMPVSILTLFNASALARFTRASALDNLNQDYVRTARSKGLAENKVVNVHVMRNSLIPVVTLLALTLPGVLSGAIITETIFRINGIGDLLIGSIRSGDIFLVQSLVFFIAFLTVAFNLIADVIYGVLDPRIRYD